MTRAADYTIQGFLYQFHKTLYEILNKSLEASVSIEGIIEDVEVMHEGVTEAIQCKYHESVNNFTLSKLYKPLLQMMNHFYDSGNKYSNVTYVLYAYFPGQVGKELEITKTDIETIMTTKNRDLVKMTNKLKNKIDIDTFLQNFTMEFGTSMEEIRVKIFDSLEKLDFKHDHIDNLVYPNAIQLVAEISTNHTATERVVKVADFVGELRRIKSTALSKWTLSLKNYKDIVQTRKRQLNENLKQNSRLRYFIIKADFIEDFDDCIVTFIKEYLDKYHFKMIHNMTPLFCLDCKEEDFDEILHRLYQKQIKANYGFITPRFFNETYFFKEPVIHYQKQKIISREFDIRLLHVNRHELLNKYRADDLFIISDNNYTLEKKDINLEKIELRDMNSIKFVLGMRSTYE